MYSSSEGGGGEEGARALSRARAPFFFSNIQVVFFILLTKINVLSLKRDRKKTGLVFGFFSSPIRPLRIPFRGMVVPLLDYLASKGGSFLFSPYQDRGSESGREFDRENSFKPSIFLETLSIWVF